MARTHRFLCVHERVTRARSRLLVNNFATRYPLLPWTDLYSLELSTGRVWNYTEDCYAHRALRGHPASSDHGGHFGRRDHHRRWDLGEASRGESRTGDGRGDGGEARGSPASLYPKVWATVLLGIVLFCAKLVFSCFCLHKLLISCRAATDPALLVTIRRICSVITLPISFPRIIRAFASQLAIMCSGGVRRARAGGDVEGSRGVSGIRSACGKTA